MKRYFVLTLIFSVAIAFGQQNIINGFSFNRNLNVPVIDDTGNQLPMPWLGGTNYTHFANVDIDLDGTQDLVVLEKDGMRILPFITTSSNGSTSLVYAPQYVSNFPEMHQWVISADYNCDGKMDLFVGVDRKIRVFENVSNGSELRFTKAHSTSYLESQFPLGTTSIPSSSVDVPAIMDVDGNGSIDILSLDNNDGTAYYHKNISNCGLDFQLDAPCWGLFTEDGVKNDITFNNCPGNQTGKRKGASKTMHAGGALLGLDLDGDNLKDLLMSDVSFGTILALYNGGKTDSAVISNKDTLYPTSNPADVYVFPAMSYADADGDGVKDLILSPIETFNLVSPTLVSGSNNVNNTWLYLNTGTDNNPNFVFSKTDFLQENTIDMGEGAVPRLVDLNGDGLQDLVLANDGEFVSPGVYAAYFRYYQNVGTKDSAAFELIDADFTQMSSYNLGQAAIPTFGDLDGDGDQDMIVGDNSGMLHLFDNIGTAQNPNFTLQTAGLGNFDVGNYAAPFLYDVNGDSILDLVVGNERGRLSYFSNNSATSPNFTLRTSSFGGVRVTSTISGSPRAVPYIFADSTGNMNLMVGAEGLGVWQYDSLGTQVGATATQNFQFGTDSVFTTSDADSPFGVRKRSGRNQIIISASELSAMGIKFGYIDAFSLFADLPSSLPQPYQMQKGFTISMKNTSSPNLATGFEGGLTNVVSDKRYAWASGWNRIELDEPFLYDGSSSLVVEFCYSGNFVAPANMNFAQTDVGFNAHAYGDADKNGYNTPLANQNCNMPWETSSTLRPNIKLEVSPAFDNTSKILNYGNRTAPAFGDLNDDGFIDAIIGISTGGVLYFEGEKYVNTFNLPEEALQKTKSFTVYPNPGNGQYFVKREDASKATLHVYSISGSLLSTQNLNEELSEINLSQLPTGLYIFAVQNEKGIQTQKVIKQ